MSLLLNVPFAEKDEAKSLGAKWNPSCKKWYVESRQDYPKFSKWLLNDNDETFIICDYFYIIEGFRECFKCHHKTRVIGFGIENYYTLWNDPEEPFYYNSGIIHIASELEGLPASFYDFLKKEYNYYNSYSKTLNSYCYSNHCQKCNMLQGSFFLFSEVDSPFFIDSISSAAKLTLSRIKLEQDIQADIGLGYGSEDYLIKKHAKIIDINYSF